MKILRSSIFWLMIILVLGFLVRLYKIDNPIADWHSWRQADTAAVARNFYKHGFNPFVPKYDDLSWVSEKVNNLPLNNPEGYRFVEFPIYNSLVYFLYLLTGGVDERLARLVSIFFSLGSTVFVYLITKKYLDNITGLLAAFIFAMLPFNIYFSRTILPEPALVFFSLGAFYLVEEWIWTNSRRTYCISLFFTTAALLIKPQAVFYLIPLLYTYYKKEGKLWPVPKRYFYLILPAILPFILWRVWMSQFPEGIPASNWLFNGTGIRFRPAFWKWIISDRIGREILSITGTFLFFFGLLKRPGGKESPMLQLLFLSLLVYMLVFATGNVTHDYYQVFLVPVLAIFVARGTMLLIRGVNGFIPRLWTVPLGIFFLALTFYLSWGEVKGLYQINNNSIIEAGRMADKILPKDARVIAPYNGDTAFLYQTNRAGWPTNYLIDYLKKDFGVGYYVSVNFDNKTNWVMRRFNVIFQSPKFVIVDLTKEKPGFDITTDPEPS